MKQFRTLLAFLLFSCLVPMMGWGQTTVVTQTAVGNYSITIPSGVSTITTECNGGGGGGGGTLTNTWARGGGGAGGVYIKTLVNVSATTYLYTVGAGGGSGAAGGSSYFGNASAGNPLGSVVLAPGGANGSNTSSNGTSNTAWSSSAFGTASTTGALPSSGYISLYAGTSGSAGTGTGNNPASLSGAGGAGAGSTGNAGGGAGGPARAGYSGAGSDGTAPGGGGSGGIQGSSSATPRVGGSGGVGKVVITYYLVPTISAVSPNTGVASNNVSITVTGTNFYNGISTITVDGVAVTTIYTNSTTLTATINVSAGSHNIGVSNTGTFGTSNSTTTQTFTASTPGSPSLAITGTLAHGSVCPGTAATTITYTITNSGGASAAGITVVSSDAQFVVSGLSSTSITASGGTATYNVTFTPTSAGAKTATITVSSTTSGSNTPTSSLTGTGTATVAQAISASAATFVDAKSATLNGNITTLGICPASTEKGFVYSITTDNANPIVGGSSVTKIAVGSIAIGAFTQGLTNLPSSTGYSYKAYVYDGTTYTYSTVQTFTTAIALVISGTTSHGSVCPGSSATPITYTITNNGAFTVAGVAASSSDAQFAPGTLSSTTIAASGTATYTVTFTPASPGAKSATITASSSTAGITSAISAITGTGTATVTQAVTSSAAGSVTAKSATLNGNVTTLGVCPASTEKGFVYSITTDNANPIVGGPSVTKIAVGSIAIGAFTQGLTNLPSSTGYSYKAYVYDGTTYTYSTVQTFTTAIALVISGTTSHGSVCPGSSATPITYTITNNGAFTVAGVAASSSDAQFAPGTLSSTTIAASGTATYTVTFTPASSGSKNATITVSSTTSGIVSATSSLTGTGTSPATQAVTTSAASPVSFTTAQLNGNLNTVGICPATSEKGFVWSLTSTDADPFVGDAGVTKNSVSGVATGTYNLGLTGLANGTNYTFKAYVYNGTTYTYGATLNFTTLVPITNDDCTGAIALTVNSGEICTTTTSGTLLGATSSIAASPCTGTANDDVWYKFTATSSTHVVTVTPTNAWDVVVNVRTGNCTSNTSLKCADDLASSTSPEVITLTGLTPTTEYFVRVFSYSSSTPTDPGFTVCVTSPNYCVYEDFEGTNPPSGWIMNSIALYGGQNCSGATGMVFNGAGDYAITPAVTNPQTLTFNRQRSSDGTSWSMKVQIATSTSGTWNDVSTISTISNGSCTLETIDLSSYTGTQYVRLIDTRASGTQQRTLDDIKIICGPACTPATDPSGTISGTTPACDQTILSFSGTAPSGDVYYWQNSATGQSTTLGDAANDLVVTASGNYYVRAFKTATSCWSTNLTAAYPVTIQTATTSIAPTTAQNIATSTSGNQLTVSESSAISSRKWMYSTTQGSGYLDFSPAQTGNNYTPNFSSANTYYVVCQSTFSNTCGAEFGNEVVVTVSDPGPPIINHTALGNTTATSAQTAIATITSAIALNCTPTLTYRINGGSWQTPVNGTNTSGNSWSFTIPGQSASTLVEYFITACNATGTVTSPANVTTTSPYGSFNEYAINCTPASSGTQTIAFQGFEFAGSSGYTFSVDNTNTAPTGFQNYPAHTSAVEWKYYKQGANGSSAATDKNSCMCTSQSNSITCSGLYGQSPASTPTSASICDYANGNHQRGVLSTNPSSDYPASSRIRNGSYSYQHQQNNESAQSMILFDNIAIPDYANATNIKIRVYTASISTTSGNGADNASGNNDVVRAYVKTGTSAVAATDIVSDLSCALDWYLPNSDYYATNSLPSSSSNRRWDFNGANGNTTGKNLIEISVPDNTQNVRLLVSMQNNANTEIWAVDDIQIIADYPTSTPTTGRYFRSRQNGKWENVSTWEVSTTNGFTSPQPACEVPTYSNSDSIIIQSGHTVQITANQTVDQLRVLSGGKLVLKNVPLTFNDQSNSTDFLVDGTFEDNAASGNGISFNSGAKWKYSTGATIIKTNTSSVATYRDNYEGGISSIPINASWYYRYNGGGNPVTTAVGMFYPTLYFENTANTNNFSFNSFSMALGGSTGGFCTVKGDLNIGTTGTGSVTVYNNNLNSSPMLVNGNINVAVNSTLSNQFCPACGSADGTTTGDGKGFEVKGNVTVNGTFDVNSSTNTAKGLLKFSGTGTQIVSGSGTFDLYDVELAKTAQTLVDQQVDLETKNNLNFVGGILKTGNNEMYVSNSSTTAITGGNTSGTDKYVQGRLKRKTDGASTYTFPIGHSTQNAQGFTITPTGTNNSNLLGYLETNNTDPTQTVAYCDVETKTNAKGVPQQIGSGSAGADGALDQITFNLNSPLQWDITNPGGGISAYNVTVLGNGGQDISPVSAAGGGVAIRYLLKNGIAYNGATAASIATGGSDFSTVGFIACPNQYTLTGMTSFSKFTLNGANAGSTSLPVELISLTATPVNNTFIRIDWSTALEINNAGFEVQRSLDGKNFSKIGWVDGNGNATQQIEYSLNDYDVQAGITYYYRLKQIDFDGQFEISKLVSAKLSSDNTVDVKVYPIPAKDKLNISINAADVTIAKVKLFNVIGAEVASLELNLAKGLNTHSLETSNLAAGNYVVSIVTANDVFSQKVVIEK